MPNAREMLDVVENWLGYQHEGLSFGLRNAFDALRLYDYWQAHEDTLEEMADQWEPEDRVAALGYDPFEEESHQHETTGAAEAVEALQVARKLLDSVAFVAKEGDTKKPISKINAVLAH
jgi:hypothetical protein